MTFAFFVSIFLSKSRTATTIGFAIFLFGVITQGFVTLIYSVDTDEEYRVLFSLLPFVLLAQGVSNLSAASTGDNVGLRWFKRFDNSFFPFNSTLLWLLYDTLIYYFLAIFLDYYLGREDPRLYFKYLFKRGFVNASSTLSPSPSNDDIPQDVREERINVENDPESKKYAIRIVDLKKVYYAYFGIFPNPSKDFHAVNGLNLAVSPGELLCLLGPNGAGTHMYVYTETRIMFLTPPIYNLGKTTTIKMLTGIHGVSSGDAFIYGKSIKGVESMKEIRKRIGFCPQHDILWVRALIYIYILKAIYLTKHDVFHGNLYREN